MMNLLNAALLSGSAQEEGEAAFPGIVEIGLLLPASRAAALLSLAKDREQSVGQVLRRLIERELAQGVVPQV